MYFVFLVFHSLIRWLIVISLLATVCFSYYKTRKKLPYTKADNFFRISSMILAHIQLLIGINLYFLSPFVNYFINHFKTAVHQREVRFFGMEHSFVMLLAILIITIGAVKAKKKESDNDKHKTVYKFYLIGLLLILSSIPWSVYPWVTRPFFRWFF